MGLTGNAREKIWRITLFGLLLDGARLPKTSKLSSTPAFGVTIRPLHPWHTAGAILAVLSTLPNQVLQLRLRLVIPPVPTPTSLPSAQVQAKKNSFQLCQSKQNEEARTRAHRSSSSRCPSIRSGSILHFPQLFLLPLLLALHKRRTTKGKKQPTRRWTQSMIISPVCTLSTKQQRTSCIRLKRLIDPVPLVFCAAV